MGEELWVAPWVGTGTEVVHWVRSANWEPNPLTFHDGQVIGHWEGVEEQWQAGGDQPVPALAAPRSERTGAVLQRLELTLGETLSVQEKEEALETLRQFVRVFKLPGEPTGRTEQVHHTINVGGAVPIRQRLQKVPIHRRALVEADLDRMLADQVIELTKGPWFW